MPSRKYNEYLDSGVSDGDDDEQSDYDSEVAQGAADSRTARFSRHRSKRQKAHHSTSSASDSDSENNGSEQQAEELAQGKNHLAKEPSPTILPKPPIKSNSADPPSPPPSPPPRLNDLSDHSSTTAKPRRRRKKTHKPGVIYLSRIPPFMRPAAVTHLLAPFGTITRIFLTPEPSAAYTARKRSGGNRKRS
ncbi:MAG: hypothetical protein Q9167_004499, partial [Letrouitia subvulpina]